MIIFTLILSVFPSLHKNCGENHKMKFQKYQLDPISVQNKGKVDNFGPVVAEKNEIKHIIVKPYYHNYVTFKMILIFVTIIINKAKSKFYTWKKNLMQSMAVSLIFFIIILKYNSYNIGFMYKIKY